MPLRDARRALTAALDQGGTVGMVVDRNVAGGTVDVPVLRRHRAAADGPGAAGDGARPADLAGRGPPRVRRALLRTASAGRLPAEGNRRARLTAGMAALAAAMEEAVAVAPEQWWSIFFPIWPDLDPEAEAGTGHLEPEPAR